MKSRRLLPTIATIAAIGALLCGATAAQAAVNQLIVVKTKSLIANALVGLSHPSPANRFQWYHNGLWHQQPGGMIWEYDTGPGAAAAVLWRATGMHNRHLVRLAEATFDHAIAHHRTRTGMFTGTNTSQSQQPGGIATIWFASELGTTYLELKPALNKRRARRWRSALLGAANWLIRHDALYWYTNGNDNLGNAEDFYLCYLITHQKRYLNAYNQMWSYTMHPNQAQFPGAGLRILPGTSRDFEGQQITGRQAFLAESNPGTFGYDPYYTVAQLDALARLYVISHDPRVLAVMNLLINAEIGRVNSSWMLNTSNGSRHYEPDTSVPFLTPALIVAGWIGHRPQLARFGASQFNMIYQHYSGTTGYQAPDYMGLSDEVAVILQAAGAV